MWSDDENKICSCGKKVDTTDADVVQTMNSPTGVLFKVYCSKCNEKHYMVVRTTIDKNK